MLVKHAQSQITEYHLNMSSYLNVYYHFCQGDDSAYLTRHFAYVSIYHCQIIS